MSNPNGKNQTHGMLFPMPNGATMRWCRCCERPHAPYYMCPAFDGLLRQAIINERNAFLYMLTRETNPTANQRVQTKHEAPIVL